MKVEEFLKNDRVRNVFLDELEWDHLYVRRGVIAVTTMKDEEHVTIDVTLHLANFEAKVPRTGAFTRLMARVEKVDPDLPIYVENLFNEGFAAKLPELGFEEVYVSYPPGPGGAQCFLKRGSSCGR